MWIDKLEKDFLALWECKIIDRPLDIFIFVEQKF